MSKQKNAVSSQPTQKTSLDTNDPTVVQMTPNSYWKIIWARVEEEKDQEEGGRPAVRVALFSILWYIDGIAACTVNRLCLLNTIRRADNQPVVQIGSMYQDTRTQRIFSNTFFTGSNNDPEQEKRREAFVAKLVPAVAAFVQRQKAHMEEHQEQRTRAINPQLKDLRELGSEMRSFMSNRRG